MHFDIAKLKLFELSALLIDANKMFTDAIKAKRPHAELVQIYNEIQEIYQQINTLKEQRMEAA